MTVTLLVVSAVFCWTPINVAYSLLVWTSLYDKWVIAITSLIYYLDALLNPLVYPLAAQEWRDAIRRVLHINHV